MDTEVRGALGVEPAGEEHSGMAPVDPNTGKPSRQNIVEEEEDGNEEEAMIEQYMDSLPQDQKEAVAPYLAPELSHIVGILTGSEALANYLAKIADPNISLVPTHKNGGQAQQNTSPVGPVSPMTPV